MDIEIDQKSATNLNIDSIASIDVDPSISIETDKNDKYQLSEIVPTAQSSNNQDADCNILNNTNDNKDESISSSFSTAFTISFDDDTLNGNASLKKREFTTKDPIRKFAPPRPNTIEKPRLPSARALREQQEALEKVQNQRTGVVHKQSPKVKNTNSIKNKLSPSSNCSRRQSNSSNYSYEYTSRNGLNNSNGQDQNGSNANGQEYSYSSISDSAAFLIDRMLYGDASSTTSSSANTQTNALRHSVNQISNSEQSKTFLKSKYLKKMPDNDDEENYLIDEDIMNLDVGVDDDGERSDNGTYVVGADPDVEAVRKQIDKIFSVNCDSGKYPNLQNNSIELNRAPISPHDSTPPIAAAKQSRGNVSQRADSKYTVQTAPRAKSPVSSASAFSYSTTPSQKAQHHNQHRQQLQSRIDRLAMNPRRGNATAAVASAAPRSSSVSRSASSSSAHESIVNTNTTNLNNHPTSLSRDVSTRHSMSSSNRRRSSSRPGSQSGCNLQYLATPSAINQTTLVTATSQQQRKNLFGIGERSLSNLTHSSIYHNKPFVRSANCNQSTRLMPASRIVGKQQQNQQDLLSSLCKLDKLLQVELETKLSMFGQCWPDFHEAIPRHIVDGLVQAVTSSNYLVNQYTRDFGHPRLVNALSYLYSNLLGRSVDAHSEILVTIGATEAIHCIINAFVDKDSEVIIIEPYFESYEPMVRLAGGRGIFVPLRLRPKNKNKFQVSTITTSADWVLDKTELEASITPRTKMLILNNPHNPLGKVFSRCELEMLSHVCIKHDIMVLSDEVYEHLVLDGEHLRISSLPGMWERTITVGSAGKTFSITGWKLGWCYGPKELMRYVQFIHQNCIHACPTPLQEAVASSFEIEIARMGTEDCYWNLLVESLRQKRDQFVAILQQANIDVTIPEGGYFMIADTTNNSWSRLLSATTQYAIPSNHPSNHDHCSNLKSSAKSSPAPTPTPSSSSPVANSIASANQVSTSNNLLETYSNNKFQKEMDFMKWVKEKKKLRSILLNTFYSPEHKTRADDFIRLCYFKSDLTLNDFSKLIYSLLK